MINLEDVTLVSVDTYEDSVNTRNAIKISQKGRKYKKSKLFVNEKNFIDENFDCDIVILKDKINTKEDYSKWCLLNLNNYIDTLYVLLIQSDGFVLNPYIWTNDYLKYDYRIRLINI